MSLKIKKVVHIVFNEKVVTPFYKLLQELSGEDEHVFIYLPGIDETKCPIPNNSNIIKITSDSKEFRNKVNLFLLLNRYCKDAKKVILHSLIQQDVVRFLFIFRWHLDKCYWIMWGADLYSYKKVRVSFKSKLGQFARNYVFRNVRYLVSGTYGDFVLAQKVYKANGSYINCFNYPSNLYKEIEIRTKKNSLINVLVGNSGDLTNNHEKVFKVLKQYEVPFLKVHCPLSYGAIENIKKIKKLGYSLFGSKFEPMLGFLPLEEYLIELSKINIAVFAHERQQALGNIITLLGLGKTVYLSRNNTLFEMLESKGIKVHDIDFFSLKEQDEAVSSLNMKIVQKEFSKESLIKSLKKWVT